MKLLKLGSRYKSAVCDTQIMVIRATKDEVDLRCGGAAMIDMNASAEMGAGPDPSFSTGTLIGKRYINGDDSIELLCTKGGQGSLSLGPNLLAVKQAKALPSSD